MDSDSKYPIKKQLIGGFSLIVFIFIFVGVISFAEINKLGSLTTTIYNHPVKVSTAALLASMGASKIHRRIEDIALIDDQATREKVFNEIDEESKAVLAHLDVVRNLITGAEGQALEQETRKMFLHNVLIHKDVVLLTGKDELNKAATIIMGKDADHELLLEQQMLILTSYAHDKADVFLGQSKRVVGRFTFLTAITVSLGSLLSILIAFLTIRNVASSLALRRKAEDQLYVFFQDAPIGMATAASDGKIVRANTAFCKMLGYTERELQTKTNRDLTYPDDHHLTSKYMKRMADGEVDFFETEKRYIHKNGTVVWALLNLVIHRKEDPRESYYIAQIQDITERKVAKESAQRLSRLLDSSLNEIFIFDAETLRFVEVNKGAQENLGYTLEELQDFTPLDLKPEFTEELFAELVEPLRTGAEEKIEYKTLHRRKDGTLYPVEIHLQLMLEGTPVFVAMVIDITDRRKAEDEKVLLEFQLQQAQKMEAIGTLAGGIAHDFNNILGIILGYAEMAKDDAVPGSTLSTELNQIITAGHRAKDLVRQILAFSRQAQVEKVVLKPQPIIKEALKMLRASIPVTIEIKENISPECGGIEIDPTQLHQILVNLCTNAFQAMEETGGVLDVDLKVADSVPLELTEGQPGADQVFIELSVSDTGTGIDPGIIDKVFEPFFTTKDTGKGTGMGLAIIYGIVKECGGTISVDSQAGKGTTFHVYFPHSQEEVVTASTEKIAPGGNERILFVDDEELLVDMGGKMLERLGYHVTTRQNSLEALEIFREQPDEFDLVITDHTMPNMTGLDLAREMLKIRPDLPIIMCTGYSSQVNESEAMAQGIKGFALKPVAKSAIANLIRQVLNGEGSA